MARYDGGLRASEENFDLEDPVGKKATPGDDADEDDVDMDTDVDFQKIDEDQDREMSDEEIDKLLEKKSAMRTFSDFLKTKFRR